MGKKLLNDIARAIIWRIARLGEDNDIGYPRPPRPRYAGYVPTSARGVEDKGQFCGEHPP